jgi:ATP synthase protein I
MSYETDDNPLKPKPALSEKVGVKAARKLHARRRNKRTTWLGLGMMGLIGWSVAVPTLLGVGLGVWIDRSYPGRYSWTLMLLIGGLIIGCLTAWYWVAKEEKQIREEEEEDNNGE